MRTLVQSVSIAFFAAFLVAGTALAQTAGAQRNPEEMLNRQMSQLKSRLKLTAEQEQQVRPILQQNLQQMAEVRSKSHESGQTGGPTSEMREQMSKIQQETSDKLGKVLSKEQMGEYTKIQQERRNRFRQGGRHGEGNSSR